MNEELLKKIFTYNIYWLNDEKKFGDVIIGKIEKYTDKIANKILSGADLRELRRFKNIPSYARGSLIDNSNSLALKESLRSSFFKVDIMEQFLKLNKHCVVNDFERYLQCNDSRLSRPLITLITTKENADKLKYLDKQDLRFEYLSIDYKNIKYAQEEEKRDEKPNFYKYRTMSGAFCNFLQKSTKDNNGDSFFYIPTELGKIRITDKERIKSRGNFTKDKTIYEKQSKLYLQELETLRKLKVKQSTGTYGPDVKQEIKDIEERLEKAKENLEDKASKLNQLTVKNEYILESDYEYRKILERFKVRAETKLNVKIDLDEWSFCIVFSPLWCDSQNVPNKQKGGLDLLAYLVTSASDTKKAFNKQEVSATIDISILYFLTFIFQQKKVSQIDDFRKIGELNDYNIVLRGFREFENGGHWVKKIVKEKGIFKEKTEGPYSMQDAEIRKKIIDNTISLENLDVAEVFSFKDLVCNDNLLELDKNPNIQKYVKPKNRYTPPEGSQLFCLVKGYLDVVYFEKQKLTERFRKFSDHAINSGMTYMATLDYLIYYHPDKKSSIRKAGELRKILREREKYTPDNFLWLVDSIMGREIKRGEEPSVKPFKMLSEFEKGGHIEYKGLESLYQMIKEYECSEDRLGISYENFRGALGDEYETTYRNKDFDIKKELNVGIVQDMMDEKVKKFQIIKNYDRTWEIRMHRFRKKLKDIKLISVKDIEDCKGYLEIKFKDLKDKSWEVSKLNLISDDSFFNNEVVLICLTLFLCKAFGLRTVILDNRLKTSECANNIMFHYYHIYYIGMGNFETFQEIGFMVENYGEYEEVIDSVKEMKITDFVEKNKLSVKVDKQVRDLTLQRFCNDFIKAKSCFSKNNLILINQISAYVHALVSIEIFIDLEEVSFNHLSQYIMQ